MTTEQAVEVFNWRMRESGTWRQVATLWVEAYGEAELDGEFHRGWSGNQLAGMSLTERAWEIIRAEWPG